MVGIKRGARLADGLGPRVRRWFLPNCQDITRHWGFCHEIGTEPGTVAVMRRAWIGNASEVNAFIATMETDYERDARNTGPTATQSTQELQGVGITRHVVLDWVFAGGATEVRERIDAFAKRTGIDYLIIEFQWRQRDAANILEQLETSRVVLSASTPSAA